MNVLAMGGPSKQFSSLDTDGVIIGSDAMKAKFGETSEKFIAFQQKQEKSKKDKTKSACKFAV